MHQLVEYLLGVALLSQGLQTAEPLVPAVLGALVLLNAAIVDGPLSAVKALEPLPGSPPRALDAVRRGGRPGRQPWSSVDSCSSSVRCHDRRSGAALIGVASIRRATTARGPSKRAPVGRRRRAIRGGRPRSPVGPSGRAAVQALAADPPLVGCGTCRRTTTFEPPPPDLAKIQAALGGVGTRRGGPGRVLANLKTAGMRQLLQQLVDSGWQPTQ